MSFGSRQHEPDQAEHRVTPRRRVLRGASLIFNDGNSTIDATVRDISDTGARVKVQAMFECPTNVVLKLVDGTTYDAQVRWFRNLELGLRFAGDPGVMGDPSALRIWGVYREIEKLTPANAVRDLRALHFAGDPELERLCEEWQKVHERIIVRLHPHTQRPPEEKP